MQTQEEPPLMLLSDLNTLKVCFLGICLTGEMNLYTLLFNPLLKLFCECEHDIFLKSSGAACAPVVGTAVSWINNDCPVLGVVCFYGCPSTLGSYLQPIQISVIDDFNVVKNRQTLDKKIDRQHRLLRDGYRRRGEGQCLSVWFDANCGFAHL